MTTSDRDSIIQGFRELADFIEANPGLRLPLVIEFSCPIIAETDDIERAEVDRIAEILTVTPRSVHRNTHYIAERYFGPIVYRAISITDEEIARYNAATTYLSSVDPE